MRVVLDKNVLMPALFGAGLCEALFELLLDTTGATIVVSEHILDEVRAHASRKFGAPRADVDAAVGYLRRIARVVEQATLPRSACDDPDDLPVLGTAVAGQTDALVTGDARLLALGNVHGIPILSPRDFYNRLR